MRKEKLEEINKLIEKYKTIKVENKHAVTGKSFLQISQADYTLANGETITRDTLTKNGIAGSSCVILPITENNEVILVAQARVNTKLGVGIELPAGLRENDEDPKEAALRELQEETGYTTDNLIHLSESYQDEGCSSATVNSYLALNCKKVSEQKLDSDEFLDIFYCTVPEVYEMMDKGYIMGGISQLALEKSRKYLKMN